MSVNEVFHLYSSIILRLNCTCLSDSGKILLKFMIIRIAVRDLQNALENVYYDRSRHRFTK